MIVLNGSCINNSRSLVRKYARIFVRGHYLFREVNSFPQALLSENCELQKTDNVQGQMSEHIFTPNGSYCLYYPSNLFRNARNFQNSWGIFSDIPQFSWGIFSHVTHLDQSRASKTISWIIRLNIPQLTLENIQMILIFLNFQNSVCCIKYLKGRTQKTHMSSKICLLDICPRHNLFLKALFSTSEYI